MSNYPDGMTASDWRHLDGGPECVECGAEQNQEDIENGICWNCEEPSGHGPDEEPDPDEARDRMLEED
tara:strand:- start:113 stop:316 length:204 start_codon:yes stop_codon:yes gene_type:complete